MLITFLVFVLLVLHTQAGGTVAIFGGSGKFTRVHFKDNEATGVSNLLFSYNIYYILECNRNLVEAIAVYK